MQLVITGGGILIALWLVISVWNGRTISTPFNGALTGLWTSLIVGCAYAICMIFWMASESITRSDTLLEILRISFVTFIYGVLFGITPAVAIGVLSGWLVAVWFRWRYRFISPRRAAIEAGIICFGVVLLIHTFLFLRIVHEPYVENFKAFFLSGAYIIAWGLPMLIYLIIGVRIGGIAFQHLLREQHELEQLFDSA